GGIARVLAAAASQSVHSRRTAMLPRVGSRRISVSVPPTRRVLRTGKRWPFSGWKGCRTSAHPKDPLGTWVVRADRRDAQRPQVAVGLRDKHSSDGVWSVSLLLERKRQFTEPPLHPIRFDVRKVLSIHTRRPLVRAALGIGVSQNILAVNLVVQSVEAILRFCLRFRV